MFRKPLNKVTPTIREAAKNFSVAIREGDTTHPVTNKNEVRYLGFQLDQLLRLHTHFKMQLQKAKNAFRANSRLFYNKSLNPRAKIICYQLLIRPLLIYAAPILWNTSASQMEKARRFERHCLRAALHIYRAEDSKYFISSKIIYDKANIPRIDNFFIKLIRNYYANLPKVNNNHMNKYCTDPQNIRELADSGYLPPHAFMHFDRQGIIQNGENLPIIYHIPRHQARKSLPTDPNNLPTLKYALTIPTRDLNDFYRLNNAYWWLTEDGKYLDEIRRRKRELAEALRLNPAPNAPAPRANTEDRLEQAINHNN